jgi:hypothetical protein
MVLVREGNARRRRSPLGRIGLLALTIVLGLSSRRFGFALPGFVATYAGDTLWALALFLFLGLILPGVTTGWVAALALVVSLFVELSQLYHASWIDSVRQTTIGGLILGFGFLWSDLACYAAGVGLGVMLEWMTAASQRRQGLSPHPARRGRDGEPVSQ